MAAVFCGETTNEWRLPDGTKTVMIAQSGKATEKRVDKDDIPIGVDGQVVGVNIASRITGLRDKQAIVSLSGFPGLQHVLQPPDLELRTHPQRLTVRPKAETAIKRPFKDRKSAIRLQAEQKQFAALIS